MFGDMPDHAETYCQRLLDGHPDVLRQETRLTKIQLLKLVEWLQMHGGLEATSTVSQVLKVMIFCYICGKGATTRDAAAHFMRSVSIISAAFHEVLDAMQYLFEAYVRLPEDMHQTPKAIADDPKLALFLDCIGAIDGTHIFTSVKGTTREATGAEVWRNRKGVLSQNVLAVCDFDMNFLVVHAGWEGSAHDATVLKDARAKGLLNLPADKYLVADAGYTERTGYGGLVLAPYSAVRYHLQEWAHSTNRPQDKEELFNLRHAQLRNVVERIFGVFKNRFHIFDKARDGYSMETQVKLVHALTGLHNFINSFKDTDVEAEWQALVIDPERRHLVFADRPAVASGVSMQFQCQRRDVIASMMWDAYQAYHKEFGDL